MADNTFDYKKSSIKSLIASVVKEYRELKKKGHLCTNHTVGGVVHLSQWIEKDLKRKCEKFIQEKKSDKEISLDRATSKQLLDLVKAHGLFDEYGAEADSLIRKDDKGIYRGKLINVIECRNWVVHSYFYEHREESFDSGANKIFLNIVRNLGFFDAENYKKLEKNSKGKWASLAGGAGLIEFKPEHIESVGYSGNTIVEHGIKRDVEARITCRSDWCVFKLVLTKGLMYELLGCLDKNALSIYANETSFCLEGE